MVAVHRVLNSARARGERQRDAIAMRINERLKMNVWISPFLSPNFTHNKKIVADEIFGQMPAYLFEKVSVGVKSGMKERFGNLSRRVRG